MKENLINLSFLAAGHIVQDIVLVDNDQILTPEEVVSMLNSGEAFTSVHEDNDVILVDGTVIATVRYSDTELEYSDFQVESGAYEQEAAKPFDATRLALAGAIEEFIYEEDKSVTEIIDILTAAMNDGVEPMTVLTVEEQHQGMSAKALLKEIDLFAHGLKSLMEVAYEAGKKGQELI